MIIVGYIHHVGDSEQPERTGSIYVAPRFVCAGKYGKPIS